MNTWILTCDKTDTSEIVSTSVQTQLIEPHLLMHYFDNVFNKIWSLYKININVKIDFDPFLIAQ